MKRSKEQRIAGASAGMVEDVGALGPRRLALFTTFALVGAVLLACAPKPPRNVAPVRAPEGAVHTAALANARCASCHAEIAAEWSGSNHAAAFRHATFRTAFALEPVDECADCHAPESAGDRAESETDLGVGCVTCHASATLSTRSGHEPWVPHPERRKTARLDPSRPDALCEDCHEVRYTDTRFVLQRTASEHRASRTRDTPCLSCHMPRVTTEAGSHVDHRVFASRDPKLVAEAATLEVTHEGTDVRFSFTRAKAGHAFPTGDVFRRLRLVVRDASGKRAERILSRKTRETPERDDRPFADGEDRSVATVDVRALSAPFTWEVIYERVGHPTESNGPGAVIDGSSVVARGSTP